MSFSRHNRVAATWLIAVAAGTLAPAALYAAQPEPNAQTAGARKPDSDELSLTLREAIAAALAKNESIRIERVAFESAQAAISGAHGAYDPLLTVDAGWRSVTAPINSAFSGAPDGALAPTARTTEGGATLEQLLPSGGLITLTAGTARATTNDAFALLSPAYETRLGVELRQPLLRDRVIDPARLTLRVAAADRDRAAGSLRRQLTETVAAVERAYWGLVAARRAVGVEEDTVALASQQLQQTRARIESGSSPETEIAQPRAELERRRGDLLAARENASRAETALKNLILGDDTAAWSERLKPVDPIGIEPIPVDVQEATQRALSARPELAIAHATVGRRQAETAFAHDQARPALDLVLAHDRYGLAGSRNPSSPDVPGLPGEVPARLEGGLGDALGQLGNGSLDDTRLAVELQLPIGNRSARANAAIARNAQVQAEADVSRVRKAIRREVLDAAAATETANARIEATRAAREAAEVQLASEEDRFEAGLSTNFLVLTRQNDLAAARLAELQALTDYRIALTEMSRATGSLLEERGIEVE